MISTQSPLWLPAVLGAVLAVYITLVSFSLLVGLYYLIAFAFGRM